MFVCENPGGQEKVHKAGMEFFSLIFRIYIQTKLSEEQKKISRRLKSTKLIIMLRCQALSISFRSGVLCESGPISKAAHPSL